MSIVERCMKMSLLIFVLLCSSYLYGTSPIQPVVSFADIARLSIRATDNPSVPGSDVQIVPAASSMTVQEQQRIFYEIFDKATPVLHRDSVTARDCHEGHMRLLQDLNVFELQGKDLAVVGKSLLMQVKRTKTVYGDLMLAYMLANPTTDLSCLQRRQETVQALLTNNNAKLCGSILDGVRVHEDGMAQIFVPFTRFEQQRIDELFLKGRLSRYNTSVGAMFFKLSTKTLFSLKWPTMLAVAGGVCISKLLGVIAQIAANFYAQRAEAAGTLEEHLGTDRDKMECFIAMDTLGFNTAGRDAYMWNKVAKFLQSNFGSRDLMRWLFNPILHLKAGWNVVRTYKEGSEDSWGFSYKGAAKVWIMRAGICIAPWYFVYRDLCSVGKMLETATYIQKQLIHIARVVEAFDQFRLMARSCPQLQQMFTDYENINRHSVQFEQLLTLLRTKTFRSFSSFFSHHGRILAAYTLLQRTKGEFVPMLKLIGQIDAYRSIATLYEECRGMENCYSFAAFATQREPIMDVQQFWNPLVLNKPNYTNSIRLGGKNDGRIAVVTGANSAGKSTIMANGLGVIPLLSQTLSIVPACKVVMTPFHYIHTAINVQDSVARGMSHFKAETEHAARMVKAIKQLPVDHKMFVILDEFLEATDSHTGHKSLRSLLQRLVKYPNILGVAVTQHRELHGPTGLESVTDGMCKNYKVDALVMPDGSIERPRKVEPGISTVLIGDTLMEEAFKQYDV